ncbi:flagellar hook-associated protein FlgK [Sanguibacter sp. HDW7]|uniref:flagellar hook-associated protein FlgK n=1 Tax=Sanguibacter sp. HDW7 TaxID=2714931 RepID=UPI00140DA3E5|nr:flagellar hook-associated protein FlgK [Sanguibacter sp. HDW7]QIK84318.1 flagellar hook-associated protein FlgK [Sanguibacter sp. HDW7]
MSSFSTLSTALSSLHTQRAALDVAGQNIANANTVGYTRQRAETSSVSATAAASRFSSGLTVGQGVKVTGVARLGDIFADARVRSSTSLAADLAARATTLTRLESTISEPGDKGLSAQLAQFWAGWQDVANSPGSPAPGQVVLESANILAEGVATGYRAVRTQWDETRAQSVAYVEEVNSAAASLAELNDAIRSVTVSGGNANELMDKRDLLSTQLAELTGATTRLQEDGTVTVSVGGNHLVSGDTAYRINLVGSTTLVGAAADGPRLEWERTSAGPVTLDGGLLAGNLASLQGERSDRSGGALAEAAAAYNKLATQLHDRVNAVHSTGTTTVGTPGGSFFALSVDPGTPAALGLTVAVKDPADIAAGAPGNGAYDGSVADEIGRIGASADSPDRAWSAFVVDLGVRTQAAMRSAEVSEQSRQTASLVRLSGSSVDIDEETVNMLAFQRAYQGAARVLTTVDEMLDTLINRTGVVGR